ncbi:hypothetical protein [Haloplanus halophilus]|uniref:hypothetical protein n=1 Tax=Haloplanus halophilus TaxID=2949993 RepID=UPI00203AB771|nr:hypothetical protein [Haloplanus sp. GDY1]
MIDSHDATRAILRRLLLGEQVDRTLEVVGAAAVFLGTFAAYATGVFAVAGGVVLLPGDATALGIVVAAGVGYRNGGLVAAWVAPFAAYLGFDAEWALLGLSSHGLPGRLSFLFDPTGLAVAAAGALVFGTAGFAVGSLVRASVDYVREGDATP